MSLLNRRARAAWHVWLDEGESSSAAVGGVRRYLLDGSLAVASGFDLNGRAHDAEEAVPPPTWTSFSTDPLHGLVHGTEGTRNVIPAIGALMPVGMTRRPQDHNGITDDVVMVMSLADGSVDAMQCGATIATYFAALFDGWDMESARYQSYFVARRAAAFGDRTAFIGNFTSTLNGAYDAYESVRDEGMTVAKAVEALSPAPTFLFAAIDDNDVLKPATVFQVTAHAIAFTYALRDHPILASPAAMAQALPGPSHAARALFDLMVAAFMGAFRPDASSNGNRDPREALEDPVEGHLQRLTHMRYARW